MTSLVKLWVTHSDPPKLAPGQTRGVVELGQGGTGGLLISSEVLRAMSPPWFEFGKAVSWGAGEDGWFMLKARRLGFRMFCDLDARMSHMNTCSIWPQVDAKGKIAPLFQFSHAPRISDYAFSAPAGSVERWEAISEQIKTDPDSLRF